MKIRDKHAEKDVYIPPQATEEEYPVYEEPQIDKDLLDFFKNSRAFKEYCETELLNEQLDV